MIRLTVSSHPTEKKHERNNGDRLNGVKCLSSKNAAWIAEKDRRWSIRRRLSPRCGKWTSETSSKCRWWATYWPRIPHGASPVGDEHDAQEMRGKEAKSSRERKEDSTDTHTHTICDYGLVRCAIGPRHLSAETHFPPAAPDGRSRRATGGSATKKYWSNQLKMRGKTDKAAVAERPIGKQRSRLTW